jgi:hypothetical protein
MKNGIAVKRKESAPATIFKAAIEKGKCCKNKARHELNSIAKPMGIPITRKAPSNPKRMMIMVPGSIESSLCDV